MQKRGKEIKIYKTQTGTEIQVNLDRETIWLTQKQMAELFDKDTDTISLHLKNIYREEELEENATTEYSSLVQKEGKRIVNRKVKLYNLDAILSVGYRINSKRGTQFRQWATQKLKDVLVQGYSINQKRLDELQQTVQLIKNQ
ncbi:MAG: virulence RhuM family protein [Crocinitomicaceae bacterium]|nr:virulence RhuM family protein [Crocinitomicaceae bacterium]